jgi:hypothetical protein
MNSSTDFPTEAKKGNGGHAPVANPAPEPLAKRKSRVDAQIEAFLSYIGEPVRPESQDGFVNNFPNLLADRPGGFDILLGERERYLHAMLFVAGARNRLRFAPGFPSDPAKRSAALGDAGRRALWEYLGNAYRLPEYDAGYGQLVQCVKDARLTVDRLLDVYFPEQMRLELDMTSDIENADDPLELMRLCSHNGSDILSRRTRFEAARQLVLAQQYFEMRRDGNSPEGLDQAMNELDELLKRRFFVHGRSACYEVAAELDPDDFYRVKALCPSPLKPGGRRLKSHESLVVMYPSMRFIPGAEDVPVFYQTRIKQDAPLKQIMKNRRDTRTVRDLLGAEFVCLNENDLFRVVQRMRRTVVCVPGTVFGEESNLSRSGVVNDRNRYTSEEFRVTKYYARIRDRWYELQFKLMRDWINERCSSGRENHILYKAHAVLVELFPKLFPSELYFDWADPELRLSLVRLQLARIWS